jgi:DNA-binding CsgD family transcriptional regulator
LNSAGVLELVRGRSSPGVLILGLDKRLLYSNREALSFFGNLDNVPLEVIELCEQAELGGETGDNCAILSRQDGQNYSLRAFLIGGTANRQPATHVMVLIEKVTEKHDINLKKAKSGFGLSARELEIVTLVSRGLSNKEIGSGLFLSEHTVKDHLKNVMRKMAVSSRGEIVAMLK